MIDKNHIITIAVFAGIFGAATIYQKCKSDVISPQAPPGVIEKVETKKKITTKVIKEDKKTGIITTEVTIKEDVSVKTPTPVRRDNRISTGVWIDPLDLKRDKIYEVTYSRRVVGDVWSDIGVSSDKRVKIGVSIDF